MFTLFLTVLAAVLVAFLVGLLMSPKQDAMRTRVPLGAVTVAVLAVGLVALGLWLM